MKCQSSTPPRCQSCNGSPAWPSGLKFLCFYAFLSSAFQAIGHVRSRERFDFRRYSNCLLVAIIVSGYQQPLLAQAGPAQTIVQTADTNVQRSIPEDNLAYPVQITMAGSEGSGFFLNTDDSTFFVTAKHVLYNPANGSLRSNAARLMSYSKDTKEAKTNVFDLDLDTLKAAGSLKSHPTGDVVAIKIAHNGTPNEQGVVSSTAENGVNVVQVAPAGIVGVPRAGIKLFNEVVIGNDVVVYGYPTSVGLKLLPQLDHLRPLLRKGIVAGENPALKTVVIDCPSYPGNSGGPVIEIENGFAERKFRVIGVVIQFVPFDNSGWSAGGGSATLLNSGYSIVAPMDLVLDLVK